MAAASMTFLEAFGLKQPDKVVEINVAILPGRTLFDARFSRTSTSLELIISSQGKTESN
jgi:hypothetical protein